jgi:hypothetical protein
MNCVHIFISNCLNVHFNIIFSSMRTSPK